MLRRNFGLRTHRFASAMLVALAILQASCGGGGGGGSSTASLDVNPIGGYYILGSTVTVKGANGVSISGTGNLTTGAVSFTPLQLASLGNPPYLIKISGGTANGVARTTDLYSIATATGGRVNVSPITHLLAVQATGSTNSAGLAALFNGTGFNAAKAASLSSAAISAAKANVETALKAANPLIDLAGADPLTVAITFGDTNDGLLDQLNLTLKNTSGATLDTLQAFVATTAAGGTPITTTIKPFNRVIVFGDSLSDGGAYTAWASYAASGANRFVGTTLFDKLAAAAPYGGKFTTNPGKVWVENLASTLGYDLKPANLMGGGNASLNLTTLGACTTCTNYAQGGSRVALQPGIGNTGTTANPMNVAVPAVGFAGNAAGAAIAATPVLLGAATADYTVTNAFLGASTLPVVQQIDQHLASTYVTAGQFDPKDLVIVLAGANDVFTQAGLAGAGAGAITSTQAGTAVGTAAAALATQVARLKTAGAKNVLVVGLPNMGVNPYASAQGAAAAGALTSLSQTAFNATLKASLPTTGVAYLDPVPLFTTVLASPSTFGFTKVVDTTSATTALESAACGPNTIAQATVADSATSPSSLYCSVANTTLGIVGTLRALLANETYVFADGVHPTPKMHKVLTQYIINKMGLLLAAAI